jgi:hypothetical protein
MSDLTNKLAMIQQKLKAPKSQVNTFATYKYRSCEDILEAVKPLLNDLVLTISDDIVEVGGRVYVKATASLSSGSGSHIDYGVCSRVIIKEGHGRFTDNRIGKFLC